MESLSQVTILRDVSPAGKVRPWAEKKVGNELLAAAYEKINPAKSIRLRECGKFLLFRRYSDGVRQLHGMTSCRVRLCPICAWRRSLKVFFTIKRVVDFCFQRSGFSYIFLTLTVRNCSADMLSKTIDEMMAAWNLLLTYKPVKSAVQGWYRGLEITHNCCYSSGNFDSYHPHFHVLIAVNPSYFKSRFYLSKSRWAALWKQALGVDYDPVVDVRKVKGNTSEAVAECAKYSVKDTDYILPDDWDLTLDTVRVLDAVLASRRLVAYGGEFRKVKRILQIEDEDTGSLVNVGDDEYFPEDPENFVLESYAWFSGYRQYRLEAEFLPK